MTHDLPLDFAAVSDPGRHRRQNEDSGYASGRLCAVADGIGGHPHGDVASTLAISVLAELDDRLPADLRATDLSGALSGAVAEARDRIARHAARAPGFSGMGTTLTAVLTDGQRVALAHIGDSRAYLLRAGTLRRITRDHTLTQTLVDEGRLSPAEAMGNPRSSMLLRALQTAGSGMPDLALDELRPGDRFLLCSDGLTDVIDDAAVLAALADRATPETIARRLVDAANAAGGPDNITCVVCEVPADVSTGTVSTGTVPTGTVSTGTLPTGTVSTGTGETARIPVATATDRTAPIPAGGAPAGPARTMVGAVAGPRPAPTAGATATGGD